MTRAEAAVARLGTAFQIVDDLTDFEFDLGRRSHNLLVAQIEHAGNREERTELERARADAQGPGGVTPGIVEGLFKRSARAVLARAYQEAHAALAGLAEVGFWLEAELAEEIVHAIVGKLSFDSPKLTENVQAFLDKVSSLKPAAVKGTFIKTAHLSATMSPSVRLAV